MKLISLLLVAVAVASLSCERHQFDGSKGTRQLHDSPPSHQEQAGHDEHPAR